MSLTTVKSALHRNVWQRLPQTWRREALFRATTFTAPRPSAGALPAHPIHVVGTFRTASGLGQSARFCRDGLRSAGVEVRSIDITAPMMQPVDFEDGHERYDQIAEGAGTIILHINAPLVPLALIRLGRAAVHGKYIVGCWAWELERTPPDWRHGISFVHEIWMPARFGAAAVAPIAAGRPVRTVPYAVMTGRKPTARNDHPTRPFTVLTMFSMASSVARKNPLAAIAAFRRAFGDDPDVRLVVKASRGDAYPAGLDQLRHAIDGARNIVIDDRVLPTAEIDALYAGADTVLSLHRSEGFGLLVAEAMARGIPVVATDWSATTDFLDASCGVPVSCRLVPATDPQGTYDHPDMVWADADVDDAARALVRLRSDPDLRRKLGEAGARRATELWSGDVYARAVMHHLRLPSRPQ